MFSLAIKITSKNKVKPSLFILHLNAIGRSKVSKIFFFFFSYFGFVGSVKFLEACYMMSLVSFMDDAIHFIEKEIWQP